MICFGCLYFGFKKLEKWCLHPERNKAVGAAHPTKCTGFVYWDIKVAPGQVATWPRPVRIEEI